MIPPSAPGPDRGALSSPCGGGPRRLASQIAPWLFVAGLLLQLPTLTWIGIILFGSSSLFAFLTLPVEFNASARAQKPPCFRETLWRDKQNTGSGCRNLAAACSSPMADWRRRLSFAKAGSFLVSKLSSSSTT